MENSSSKKHEGVDDATRLHAFARVSMIPLGLVVLACLPLFIYFADGGVGSVFAVVGVVCLALLGLAIQVVSSMGPENEHE